ncbi:thioredoxin domain-containing protein [Nostoc sp. KVJ3]|nr:thioredoxin domain-containing protein [Nostoc sp. KVJ3]
MFALHKESRKRVAYSTLATSIRPSEVSVTFDPDRMLFVPPSTQDRIKGVLNATVVLVMYGDYECSQSADVYRLIKVIERQLSVSLGENYLCFIFRHFPQIEIHSHAQRAAEATEAAAVQGQFWPMHEMLFDHQQELGNGYLVEYANNLGLDISQFLQDISKKVYIDRINEDIESGLHSGVTSAPALFINGIRYSNRWTVKQIMAAIVAAND